MFEELLQLAAGMEGEKDSWTNFTIVTKARPLLIGVPLLYSPPWRRHSIKNLCLGF